MYFQFLNVCTELKVWADVYWKTRFESGYCVGQNYLHVHMRAIAMWICNAFSSKKGFRRLFDIKTLLRSLHAKKDMELRLTFSIPSCSTLYPFTSQINSLVLYHIERTKFVDINIFNWFTTERTLSSPYFQIPRRWRVKRKCQTNPTLVLFSSKASR